RHVIVFQGEAVGIRVEHGDQIASDGKGQGEWLTLRLAWTQGNGESLLQPKGPVYVPLAQRAAGILQAIALDVWRCRARGMQFLAVSVCREGDFRLGRSRNQIDSIGGEVRHQ